MPMDFATTDLSDEFGEELQVCAPLFRDFGGRVRFAGPIATIKCFEDNSLVRDLVAQRLRHLRLHSRFRRDRTHEYRREGARHESAQDR